MKSVFITFVHIFVPAQVSKDHNKHGQEKSLLYRSDDVKSQKIPVEI